MTRLGITLVDVELSAEKILATGENPTIEKVRRALGTGSNSTIAKYLHDWRSKRLTTSVAPLSTAPPDSVHAAVSQVWQQLHEKSQEEIREVRTQTDKAVAIAHQQLVDALAARDHLIQQFDALQKQFHQISAEKELLSLDLKASRQEKQLLQERYQSLEERYQLLEQQSNSHIAGLKEAQQQSLALHQQAMASLKSTHDKAMDEFSLLHENERQRQSVVLDAAKVEKQQQEKTIMQLEKELQQIKTAFTEAKITLQVMTQERDTLIKSNFDQEANLTKEKNTIENLQKRLSHLDEIRQQINEQQANAHAFFAAQDHVNTMTETTLKSILHLLEKQKETVEQT